MLCSAVFDILSEERTVRLLVLPVGTFTIAATMTVLNTVTNEHEDVENEEEQSLFISNAMNNEYPEPWSAFIARYYLWHILVFSIVSFKKRALPPDLQWVPLLNGILILVTLWSGYRQSEVPVSRALMIWTHRVFGLALVVEFWFETVTVWLRSQILNIVYASCMLIYVATFLSRAVLTASLLDTRIPFIRDKVEIPIQWFMIVSHLILAWWKYPVVHAAMESGSWSPWLGACPCCASKDLTRDPENGTDMLPTAAD